MTGSINVSGTWKSVSDISVNVGGTWKTVTDGYVNVGGTWKSFYSSAPASSYQLISTQTLTSSSSSVTFSSIPSTYKHLQIRTVTKSTANNTQTLVRLNGSSGSYATHRIYRSNTTVASSNSSSDNYIRPNTQASSSTTNSFCATIFDVFDYASSTKNTVLKYFGGGAYVNFQLELGSGLLVNTSVLDSITFYDGGGSFEVGSRFSLYGIEG